MKIPRAFSLPGLGLSLALFLGAVLFEGSVRFAHAVDPEVVESSDADSSTPNSKIEKKKKLPKSGILSSSVSTGAVTNNIPQTWGSDSDTSGTEAPIAGSVSRMNPSSWQMKVFNQSKDTYSINVSVIQRDDRGSQVKTDSYSYTLKPGQNESRTVSAGNNSTNAVLELRSFTNLSERQRQREKKLKSDSASAGNGTTR